MRACALLLAVLGALAPVGCSETKAPTPVIHEPVAAQAATTPDERPQAVLPDGSTVVLELAVTQDEITQGLMFRPTLAEDRGMLFLFPELTFPSFWMKNTWVALDIVFLDTTGRVVDVSADAQPCPAEPCPRHVPSERALAVLELVAGAAAQHGIAIGSRVEFVYVSGYPQER